MVQVIKQTEQRARRVYSCGLAEDFGEVQFPSGMTFSERRALVRYRQKKRKILKGEIYVRQFNKYEGDVYTWVADRDLFKIFCKYDLFPER